MKMKEISEGAEAHIYSMDFLGFDCVLKRRTKKPYRINGIDRNLRLQRTRKEAKIIGLVSSFGINSPSVLLVGKYDIVMSRLYGVGLNEILNSKTGIKDLKGIFSTLGDYAATLHDRNIIHGDYTPANVIVGKDGKVYIIDFGLSDITDSVEDKALDLLLMKRGVDGVCFKEFIAKYKAKCSKSSEIIRRLEEIEKRGRYNTRTLITD